MLDTLEGLITHPQALGYTVAFIGLAIIVICLNWSRKPEPGPYDDLMRHIKKTTNDVDRMDIRIFDNTNERIH